MKRRDFLLNTSLLTGGLLLNTSWKRSSEPIRVGVIGCGDRGKGIASVIGEFKDQFSITGLCDVLDFRLEAAKKVSAASSATIYKDYRKLLDDKSIQAVVIATSLDMHFPVAKDALLAGKHIYLEKTMTFSIEEALELAKLSQKLSSQILMVGHQYRYTPLYFKVKQMIESGYLGAVTQIDCRWDRNWNWRRPVPAGYSDEQINWRMYKRHSGGLAAELLSHQMDFINWAFDTHPDEILGTGGIDFYKDGRETYDNVQAILRYSKKGMIGNFGATCGNAKEGYIFKIKGTRGMVSLLPHEGIFYPEADTRKQLQTVDGVTGASPIEWNTDGGTSIMKEKMKDGTWYALKEFHECITQGKMPVSNVKTGATTAICVHLANKAIYSHTIQNWKTAYNLV
ncbi:MAG: Gfo/Idh/MocA family oxidoreductase [Chitinophagaceae bacterium]|nr:Gfo/Idh/MocA family oxidoreductase [Chitinophagaceae bacterium]